MGDPCPVCRIATEAHDFYRCVTPNCPCEGLQPESAEAVLSASRHFLGIAARAAKRERETDPLDDFEPGGRLWREREMIDFEIEHRSL